VAHVHGRQERMAFKLRVGQIWPIATNGLPPLQYLRKTVAMLPWRYVSNCRTWASKCRTPSNNDSQLELGHTKDLKNSICCFSCFNAEHLRVAQRIKKQSVDYTSAKIKLIQSWRYKTLALIKRDKNTYLYTLSKPPTQRWQRESHSPW